MHSSAESGPSSPSSSPNGSDSSTASFERLAETWLKIRMANHLRLMQDNQRLLDTSLAEDRALRQQRHRFRERQLEHMAGQSLQFPDEATMGDIRIDSPTIHHHHAAQAARSLGSRLLPWLAALGIGAGALGILGVATGLFDRKSAAAPTAPTSPSNTTIEKREGFLLELVK